MAIQDTDLLLVNRSSVSYQVEAQSIDDVQPADILLVNRAGQSYKCTRADLAAKVLDTDILLVNRENKSYKVTGADFKDLITVLPEIGSVTLTELTPGDPRWTDQQFRMDCVMTEDGEPASTRRLTYYIEGEFAKRLKTDTITGWDAGSKTLTFASDKDIAPMEVGDVIRQDDTSIVGGWTTFDGNSSNTLNGGANSAIAQDKTQTYLVVGRGTPGSRTTYVQRGPVTNQGPWIQKAINGFTGRCARIFDDVLYLLGADDDSGNALYKSEDGGKTYEKVPLNIAGTPNDFAVFQGKYYIIGGSDLYSSTLIEGPYDKIDLENLNITYIAVTPWGMYLGVRYEGTAAYTDRVAKINNDGTVEFIPLTFNGGLPAVNYRDGLLAWTGWKGDTGSQYGDAAYMWSTDGTTFQTKFFNDKNALGYVAGITDAGTIVTSDYPKGGSPNDRSLIEFDPVSQTSTDTGIAQPVNGIQKLTYDGGALTLMYGGFSGLWTEGILAPVGIVSSFDASANTITLSSTTGDWSANTDNYAIGDAKYLDSKKNLKVVNDEVVDLLPEEQESPVITTDFTQTITFPSVFPSGRTPDAEIAPGAQLFVCVEAYNSAGTDGPVCDSVQPVAFYIESDEPPTTYSMEYDNYRELHLHFETYDYRAAVARGETPPDRDQLCASLVEQGYSLPTILRILGKEDQSSS